MGGRGRDVRDDFVLVGLGHVREEVSEEIAVGEEVCLGADGVFLGREIDAAGTCGIRCTCDDEDVDVGCDCGADLGENLPHMDGICD